MTTSPRNSSPNDEPSIGSEALPTDAPSPAKPTAVHAGEIDAVRVGLAGEIESLREELARANDRHRRALADLDNYRKRMAGEGDRRATAARTSVVLDWLEALDSVERALRLTPDDPGLRAVLDQMDAILAREGIERIGTDGAPFDPELHEAIAVHSTADVADHTVLAEARSGFRFDDGAVLRPAQVVVARQPAGEG